jgi:hypothetical protein
MVFDEAYEVVEGGACNSFDQPESTSGISHKFGRDLIYTRLRTPSPEPMAPPASS